MRVGKLKEKVLAKPITTNTGFRGITHRPNRKSPYQASFQFLGSTQVQVGSYATLEAARLARIEFIDSLK